MSAAHRKLLTVSDELMSYSNVTKHRNVFLLSEHLSIAVRMIIYKFNKKCFNNNLPTLALIKLESIVQWRSDYFILWFLIFI